MAVNLAELIKKGGVYSDVEGSSPEEIYKKLTGMLSLPDGVSADSVYKALCDREKVMSTAVGNGIALPHARIPLMKDGTEQRVCVLYLKNPIDMSAPDELKVSFMFVILSANPQAHLQVLSSLVSLFQNKEFKALLDKHAGEAELLSAIEKLA